jgi:hypothetical protein
MQNIAYKIAALILLVNDLSLAGDDWMTWRSTYTHDHYGQRVDQHSPHADPIVPQRADFQRSGYRNYRSTLQTGNSADNMHVVEQWGAPVEPYEQWRFPFRPFGVPYDAWGPQAPYGIFNGNFGGFPVPNSAGPINHGGLLLTPGLPQRDFPRPNSSNGFPLTPPYRNEPWYDGSYPAAPTLDDN